MVNPCAGSDHWSTLYDCNLLHTIQYIHEWVRRDPLETLKDEEPKPKLKVYHLDSNGDDDHRKRRPNLSDMIFLFTLFTANLNWEGNGVNDGFCRTLDGFQSSKGRVCSKNVNNCSRQHSPEGAGLWLVLYLQLEHIFDYFWGSSIQDGQ